MKHPREKGVVASAFFIDLVLVGLWGAMALWAMVRGFFAAALTLGAWIVSLALAGVLSAALAQPLYEALFANAARALIESNIDSAVQGSQAAQAAQQVIADLPEALQHLARMTGISTQGLIESLQNQAFNSASAAELLEQAVVAPIVTAAFRLILSIVLFVVLFFAAKLITRQIAKLRRLPVLKQADKLLGAALGLVKGALLVFVTALGLKAAAALGIGGEAFAEATEQSLLIRAAMSFIGVRG